MVIDSIFLIAAIIVEASGLDLTKSQLSSHVEVLDAAAIQSAAVANTVELLEKRANLFFRSSTANPAKAEISMRGYGAYGFSRVRILVDGEELNNTDLASQDLLRVPLSSLKKAEILYGPQTVLHGSNASAGVINLESEDDDYTPRGEIEFRGGSYGTAGAHAAYRGGLESDGLTYYADYDYSRSDGWRDHTGYETHSAKGGLKQRFENGAWWRFGTFYAFSEYDLPGGLFGVDWKDRARKASTPGDYARNHAYGANAAAEGVLEEDRKVRADFSFKRRASKSVFESMSSRSDTEVYVYALSLKYLDSSAIFSHDNDLAVGVDSKYDLLYVKDDFSRFSGALFARDEFYLFDSLSLFAGARGEWWYLRDTSSQNAAVTQGHSDYALEAGLNYHPIDELKLFARWTRFYHAPAADEMISYYGLPNLALKPEAGHNTEIGADWTIADDFNFNLTGYYSRLEDEILYNYGWGGNVNAPDETERTGFETSLTWTKDKIGSAGIMYSLVHTRFTDGEYRGKDVPLVPRQQLRLFGEYYLVREFAVHAGYRFVGRQRYGSDYANRYGALAAFGLFDVGAKYSPEWSPLKGFTFSFSVDNLFDKRYADYAEAGPYVYPAAGRTFLFRVKYEF